MNNNKNIYIEHIIKRINKNYVVKKVESVKKDKIEKIKIACILDRFSYDCLKYESDFYQLGVNNWKEVIDRIKPDLLFVESAWEGYNYEWINKIANMEKFRDKTLINLISYCKENSIPTVFWAKEDPTDFYIFIEASKHFEYVYTTDINCIPKHKKILGHNNVYLLPLAAQPKLHNPIEKDIRKTGKIAFAGSWYKKFEKRGKYMHNLLRPAKKHGLTIYNRFSYLNNEQFAFPEEYKPYIRKGLDYEEMVKEYKKYDIFLNVNSDDISPTAFARRIYELLACGIPVISSYNPGIENYFKDIVMISNSEEDTEKYLKKLLENKELRDKLSLLGQRRVFSNHTYEQRFNTLLNTIGLAKNSKKSKGVSIISYVDSDSIIDNILGNFVSQNYTPKELILIKGDKTKDFKKWNKVIKEHDDIVLLRVPSHPSLGTALNLGIEKSKYDYISIFDSNSFYGANYLTDMMNTFIYSKAYIAGKKTIYEYLVDNNRISLNNPEQEYRYTKSIGSSTFTFKKDLYNIVKFNDNHLNSYLSFIQNCVDKDLKIYSSDRFNHVFIKNIRGEKIIREAIEEKFKSLII